VWTLEDNKLVDMLLQKSIAHDTWSAVVKGEYEMDPLTKEQMGKKMMLEKFQSEVCLCTATSNSCPFRN
jgi:hypothetical protein